jgi:hypothetical protein
MEVLLLMRNPDKSYGSVKTKAYDFGETDMVVHRDPIDGYSWRVSDVPSGSTFSYISQTKKKAIADFYEKEILPELIDFRKTAKYKYLCEKLIDVELATLEEEVK